VCFFWQFDQQLVSYIFFVMTRDALLTSHPVSAEIKDPDDITLYFDAISYDKVSSSSLSPAFAFYLSKYKYMKTSKTHLA